MPGTDCNPPDIATLEAPWLRELSLIDSHYGRLVYLASLLNPNTGCYEHFGSTSTESEPVISLFLQRSHEESFHSWSRYSLEKKMADIQFYIAGLGSVDKVRLLDAWLRLTPYKNLVPAQIQGPERQKYISDFEAILGLLRNVYGVSSPDPCA